jgi:hypothetical protein
VKIGGKYMSIKLFVEPHVIPVSWEDFIKNYPNNSIALDGYVSDETKYLTKDKVMVNINHHENVNRLATRCTSSQIRLCSPLKLLDLFRNEKNNIEMNIYVNDCDEDVCLSYFLLKNVNISEAVFNPIINKLVDIEDKLDTCSGAYPYPKDSAILREIAWVFEPYRIARFNGHLHSKQPTVYENVIMAVEDRIMKYLIGKGNQIDVDTRYTVIGGSKKWSMVEEAGTYSRTGMMSDGINAYLSVSDRGDGTWTYSIGKMSPFVDFDIHFLYKELNKIEKITTNDLWGGSDTTGGSPRKSGSKLSPKDMEKIINDIIL